MSNVFNLPLQWETRLLGTNRNIECVIAIGLKQMRPLSRHRCVAWTTGINATWWAIASTTTITSTAIGILPLERKFECKNGVDTVDSLEKYNTTLVKDIRAFFHRASGEFLHNPLACGSWVIPEFTSSRGERTTEYPSLGVVLLYM